MSFVIIVIKLDIQIICSLFFFQLHSSRHYCGSHISFSMTTEHSHWGAVLVCPQVSCRGTRMIIDSTWNLVSTHLSGKTKTSSHTAHSSGYNVIQIRICGGIQFKRSKTNIIQRFIVERKHFIGGLNQLVNS